MKWILDRTNGKKEAIKTPIGYLPSINSLELDGLDVTTATMERLVEVKIADWEKNFKI